MAHPSAGVWPPSTPPPPCHSPSSLTLPPTCLPVPVPAPPLPRPVQLGGYAFIGEGIPVGLGAAFQIAYQQRVMGADADDRVSVNFFGDGTCNVGACVLARGRWRAAGGWAI